MAYTTINKSTDYFNPVLYTGNETARTITVGFQPDLVFTKSRSSAHYGIITDSVTGAGKRLTTPTTNAQDTTGASVASFISTGYTLTDNSTINGNSETNVSWSWKAGGSSSSNTDGTITSTVSANTTAGFSIVKWTGTASAGTIGHGLGVAPKVVLVKRYSTSGGGWLMQHGDLTGATYVIKLNTTGAEENDGANFNSAFPTSSVFSVYNSNNTNASGADHIAYCFAEKTGFSKFGSYVGNGNTDGTFVYTGFKPAFVMLKYASPNGGVGNWGIHDGVRDVDNPVQKGLLANTSDAEDTHDFMDMLSNGFKLKSTSSNRNESGSTYIYMAFAEAPLVGTNNIPSTAR